MKNTSILMVLMAVYACSGNTRNAPAVESGTTAAESRKVDSLVKNDDSLIKAKEKELLKKYQ